MSDRINITTHHSEPEAVRPPDYLEDAPFKPWETSGPVSIGRIIPIRDVPAATLDGRICILDSDSELAADLREVLESMGHEVLVLNEIIGASNRIRAFKPEILIIDSADTALPGPKLIEVLSHNLGHLPRIVFFTGMSHTELREQGLGEYEWLPKSSGFLSLVNRIRVLLMYERTEKQVAEKKAVPRA